VVILQLRYGSYPNQTFFAPTHPSRSGTSQGISGSSAADVQELNNINLNDDLSPEFQEIDNELNSL